MLMVAVASLAAAAAAPPSTGARSVQARATVRVLQSTRLRVGAEASEEGIAVKSTTILSEDGSRTPAKLVEFE